MRRSRDRLMTLGSGALAVLVLTVAVDGAGAAPRPTRTDGLVVRGATARKLPGPTDRSCYTAKHEQTVTFELDGPNVLVIDVQPHRGAEASSGARFAATLDGKDLAWIDVSCKPTTTRLATDPARGDACAAVERRFEVGKGKHRLALRLVVGESAALLPRIEAVIAKASDDLDLAPIVSNAPAVASPEAGGRPEPPKPVATASVSPSAGADLDLAPIASPATGRAPAGTDTAATSIAPAPTATARATASTGTAATPVAPPPTATARATASTGTAATPVAPAPTATARATASTGTAATPVAPAPAATPPAVAAKQPPSAPPARADDPSGAGKKQVAQPGASPADRTVVDATPAASGTRTQVAARSDLDLSPKAPGAQFGFGFLTRPVVWGPAALGAVGLGVAGYFGLQSRASFDSAEKTTVSQIGRRDLNDTGVTQAKTANVLFGVGGVALGAAAVMAAVEIFSGSGNVQGGS